MEIVAVDRWLLQLAAVDEDESEAVAISCVEFLLSETNAFYQQHCLTREAVRVVSSRLRDNVLDTVFAAVLKAEDALSQDIFQPECRPEAETKDRHAVRSVPSKSPEKPVSTRSSIPIKTSSSPASRVGSNSDKVRPRVGVSPSRRRRNPSKSEAENPSPIVVQTTAGDPEEEKPEVKEWRDKCLKDLEASTRKPGFAKYVTFARAFAVQESRVSMEFGVFTAPPPNVVEALAATPIRMKTNVDSFSSIFDTSEEVEEPNPFYDDTESSAFTRRTSRRPSNALNSPGRTLQPMSTAIHSIAENPQHHTKRRSQSANVSELALQQQRKTTLLMDSLSRQTLTRKLCSTESLSGGNSTNGWNSSRSVWRTDPEAGSATGRTFVADGSEFNAATLSATMSVASGVVLQQGENVVEGPEWVDNPTTMSRKRFDLQQRLAADALLNAPSERDSLSPRSLCLGPPLQFGHHPSSPLSELHFRDYEEVPPEPIMIPLLSPISTSALAIPRTHLSSSLSTPSLRVRPTASSGKAGGSLNSSVKDDNGGSNRSISSNSSSSSSSHASLGKLKARPATALRAITGAPTLASSRTRASSAAPGNARTSMKSAGTESAKYLREFPKPKPGVIRVMNGQAVGLLGSVDDRQRTAWMS